MRLRAALYAIYYVVLALGLAGVVGCSGKKLPDRKIENVVRVLMHEPHCYTLMARNPGSSEIKKERFNLPCCSGDNVKLFADVPDDRLMWAKASYYRRTDDIGPDGSCTYLEIHVHSEKDINGAGWNHGKFGSGQTIVIQ